MNFPHKSRDDMRCPQVEIIVGPVHVCGHHTDEIASMLFPESLAQEDAGNFCNSICLVGWFQCVGEQCLFRDGLLRLPGVDTGAPEEEEFLHPCISGREEDSILHGNVLCKEFRWLECICQYASYFSCREEDVLWFGFEEERLCFLHICEIERGVIASNDRTVSFTLEESEKCGTYHPAVACNVDARIAFHGAIEYTATSREKGDLSFKWQCLAVALIVWPLWHHSAKNMFSSSSALSSSSSQVGSLSRTIRS